jgi:hypothetical protein
VRLQSLHNPPLLTYVSAADMAVHAVLLHGL